MPYDYEANRARPINVRDVKVGDSIMFCSMGYDSVLHVREAVITRITKTTIAFNDGSILTVSTSQWFKGEIRMRASGGWSAHAGSIPDAYIKGDPRLERRIAEFRERERRMKIDKATAEAVASAHRRLTPESAREAITALQGYLAEVGADEVMSAC